MGATGIVDQIANIVQYIVTTFGGWAGLATLIGVFLYIRQERRSRDAKSREVEGKAKEKEVSATDQIEQISMRLTKEFEDRYNILQKTADKNSRLIVKLTIKIDRIVQVIRQNIEYRSALPIKDVVKTKIADADKAMLDRINAIVQENGD